MRLNEEIRRWLRFGRGVSAGRSAISRGPIDHVVILDGTMSSLEPGHESNAGLTYRLLAELAPSRHVGLKYEAGIPWSGWRRALDVIAGVGINRQIKRAYGFVASRWRPGDRIFLFGYSRGAYAVRSLAGVIDRVGLLRADCATERNIRQIYRLYQAGALDDAGRAFVRAHCHPEVRIEMVGVWDTVKALGLNLPLLWRLAPVASEFHNHELGTSVRHGYHALARDETRLAFAPVLWRCRPGCAGHVEQVWFRGAHGDVGGNLGGFEAARPLANIPLVWMLERAEGLGLPLPEGWRARFPMDATAPSVGTLRGAGKFFLLRRRRRIGADPSESLHPTARPPGPPASGFPAGAAGA